VNAGSREDNPLALDLPDEARRLREALDRAGYTPPGVAALLKIQVAEVLASGFRVAGKDRSLALHRAAGDAALNTLVRLFLLGVPVHQAAVRRALAPANLDALTEAGLLEERDGGVAATLQLTPFERLVLLHDPVSDRQFKPKHVLGIGGPSLTVAQMTVRRPSRSTLDVGTGCGILAFLAAAHSDAVIGVDLNPRAVNLAAFNAQLNGMRQVCFAQGDLYGPVRDRRFDLIVANPPYVISPASRFLYRDSGLKGDEIAQRVVREGAALLEEGGFLQLTCEWVHLAGTDWRDRLAEWFDGTGCDACVFRLTTVDPDVHAGLWLRSDPDVTAESFQESMTAWVNYHRAEGNEAISDGVITIRKRSSGRNWLRFDDAPQRTGPCGPSVERAFAAADFLTATGSDEALLEARVRLAPDVSWEQRLRPTPEGWEVRHSQLSVSTGLAYRGDADRQGLTLVELCNGERTVREVLKRLAAAGGPSPEVPHALATVRQMVEQGFLLPVTEAPRLSTRTSDSHGPLDGHSFTTSARSRESGAAIQSREPEEAAASGLPTFATHADEAVSNGGSTAYDTVAYPSNCYAATHPDRMATLATLFGMSPAPVDNCRVLELGCGEGHNLLAMAVALPGSRFVGVDLAPTAIARANREATAIGLKNVEFHCADLLDWSPPGGPIDYVVAHGLVSWVPDAVCQRVFELLRDRLAPQGVAFVSYNALPGWHVRRMLREMMLFHTRHVSDPAEKIAQAKAFMGLLSAAEAAEGTPSALLKAEAQRTLERGADEVLYHDDLAEINRPFSFHEFAALAGQHRLQFLADADFTPMHDSAYPPPVVEALAQLGGDVVVKEQYLDFLRCRRFRRTLLCRENVPLTRELTPGMVRQFLIGSSAKAESPNPDLSAGKFETFIGQSGSMQVDHPVTKAAMLELLAARPRALPFDELLAAARRRLGRPSAAESDGDSERLAADMLAGFSAVVDFHVSQPQWVVARGERPVLNRLARWQLTNRQKSLTSLCHADIRVESPALRAMLLLMDGTRDVSALAAELGRRIDAGELPLPAGTARQNLPAAVADAVRDVAAKGLLSAWDDTIDQ
jgi:methylase of polypeptide subunit release factors/methyltransferase-like protein